MNYKFSILLCSFLICLSANAQQQQSIAYYVEHAPFKMDVPKTPQFPDKTFLITDYGAKPDGTTLNTQAFQQAIDACNKAGGGIVLVPKGKWLTGPLELKSNVNLKTERDAEVQFTSDHTAYPMIKLGNKGKNFVPQSPLYAYNCENIALTGEGVFDGAGDSWREVKKSKTNPIQWQELLKKGGALSSDGKVWWPSKEAMEGEDILKRIKKNENATAEDYLPAREGLRPYMTYFISCKNVLIEGVSLRNSPKFIFYPNRCTNLTISNAKFWNEWWAQNGDAIDISACKNVVIYQTTVNAGDDGICMKSSGKSDDGSANLENIIIAECKVFRAHGGFVIGSNTDGGMNNIWVTNCNFNGSDIGIRVKSNSGRGGLVQNIYCDNIIMRNIINEAILFDTYYLDVKAGKTKEDAKEVNSDKVPEFTKFYIKNILCNGAQTAISITGLPEKKIHGLVFENINIDAKESLVFKHAEDINMTGMELNTKSPKFKMEACKNIIFNKADISGIN